MADTQDAPDPGAALIARMAERVAAARKKRGLPRRVLSELSGVSPRYLAQLESGEGNISILLLSRVAAALDLKVEALLADEIPMDHDAQRFATLYRNAPAEVQHKVSALLAPRDPGLMRAGRISLIGLRARANPPLAALQVKR